MFLHFFLMLKLLSTILIREIGSSVINSTLSRLTLANRRISLNKSVQYGLTERFSTRDKSPPTLEMLNFKLIYLLTWTICLSYKYNLPKIHCRPGTFNINGLHFVNTSLASKSCNVNNGRPSPNGSIKPSVTVISR